MIMANQEDWDNRAYQAKHGALRNALYHTARRRWLEGWSRFLNLLIIIAGTSAASDMFGYLPNITKPTAFAVAVIGALQLVYDFSGRARTHEILQKRYFDLIADIEECITFNEKLCKKWDAEMMRIAGDEPPIMRALDVIADNQATQAMSGEANRIEISLWQSATRHLIAHNAGKFPLTKKSNEQLSASI